MVRAETFSPWTAETPGAHAVNRAAVLLRILAVSGAQGLSLSEIAHLSGLPKATAHRLLSALIDEGLAERAKQTRRYRLGMEVLALAAAAGPRHDLRRIARPTIEGISRDTGYVTHLMIRSGYDAVCLDQVVTGEKPSMIGGPGSRAPLGVGANSLALLAHLSDDEIADAMARNQPRLHGHPAFSPERIRTSIRQVRKLGYCVLSVERNPRVFGVGVAILGSNRRPLAAFGVTTLDGGALTPERIEHVARRLQSDASKIATDYEAVYENDEQRWLSAGS